jgi:hypothetical protein
MNDLELTENHEYVVEVGGKPKISCTRIAHLVDDGKTDVLMRWACRLFGEGKDWETERAALGDRGTRFHNHMLGWSNGEAAEVRVDEAGLLDAAEKWKIDYGVQTIEAEQIVVSSRGYGGRFDEVSAIAAFNDDICGIDYKTGRLNDRENELQHAGYWNADGIAVYDENGMFSGVRDLPAVKRWFCFQPHDDGTYLFQEYPKRRRGQKNIPIEVLQDAAWDKFCKLLDVYAWLHPTKGVIPQ